VGAELSLSTRLAPGLALFTGVTISRADPDDTPNLPELTATLGLAYTASSGWRFSLDAEHVDERYVLNPRFAASQAPVDAYTLVDGRFGLPIEWLGFGMTGEFYIALENALDQTYEHRIGYPMPGRTLTCGFDVRL
jgi:outer membrane receptor protein involved in Fe transport